jgi:hypothetical protein
VTAATNSGDPGALFAVGQLLTDGRYSSDITRGLAISIAACEMGYDCTAANPANPFSACKDTGSCPADADFAYYIQQSLGADMYAQAYARAQELKELLAQHDTSGIDRFIVIDQEL